MAALGELAEFLAYLPISVERREIFGLTFEQRRNTLTRVAQAIVDHQTEFLNKGPESIEPLKMQQIADKVGVHVSTVSRAIAGKYMATPHGVFELKYFFTQGVATESGEDLSNTSVKNAIAEIISTETSHKPLSDDKITKMLNDKGIHVARRTIAKYREALGILPSHLRKSFS